MAGCEYDHRGAYVQLVVGDQHRNTEARGEEAENAQGEALGVLAALREGERLWSA